MSAQHGQRPIRIFRPGVTSVTEFRQEIEVPRIPALMPGAADEWSASRRWTPRFFTDHFGDSIVEVQRARSRNGYRQTSLAAYLQYCARVQSIDPYYLTNWQFAQTFPELQRDYATPPFLINWFLDVPASRDPHLRWILIGPAGSGSPAHVDVYNTASWNAVLYGQKRWSFWKPQPEPPADDPDIVAMQEPGDVVFIPTGWWHAVENEALTICVTENFVNASNAADVASAFGESGLGGWKDYVEHRHRLSCGSTRDT